MIAALLAAGTAASMSPVANASVTRQASLPGPCASFTTAQAQALFGGHPHLTKTRINSSSYRTCVVAAGARSLHVTVSRTKSGTPAHYACYSHASLGTGGRVCLSTSRSAPGTTAYVAKGGVHVVDVLSRTEPSHGKGLFTFAAHQHKSLS
jgi:hypothetical protein